MSSPPTHPMLTPHHDQPKTPSKVSIMQSNQPVCTMPSNRLAGRSVHIFDGSNRSSAIGGLRLSQGVTYANLYSMIEILIFFDGIYTLQDEGGTAVEKNESPLQPGNYYIVSPHPFQINNETPLVRTISVCTGPRTQAFSDAVRSRDRRCVVTGFEVEDNDWRGFDAAHIFPLAYEQEWKEQNFGRWISIAPSVEGTINSVQNGLLLRATVHRLFDSYAFSINPDDNYKIFCFASSARDLAGNRLDRQILDDPRKPIDQLLRWHFRQAVLINMRGAGEPIFEHDFSPGTDMIASIVEGPKGAQRMEFELFSRFAAQVDLTTGGQESCRANFPLNIGPPAESTWAMGEGEL